MKCAGGVAHHTKPLRSRQCTTPEQCSWRLGLTWSVPRRRRPELLPLVQLMVISYRFVSSTTSDKDVCRINAFSCSRGRRYVAVPNLREEGQCILRSIQTCCSTALVVLQKCHPLALRFPSNATNPSRLLIRPTILHHEGASVVQALRSDLGRTSRVVVSGGCVMILSLFDTSTQISSHRNTLEGSMTAPSALRSWRSM